MYCLICIYVYPHIIQACDACCRSCSRRCSSLVIHRVSKVAVDFSDGIPRTGICALASAAFHQLQPPFLHFPRAKGWTAGNFNTRSVRTSLSRVKPHEISQRPRLTRSGSKASRMAAEPLSDSRQQWWPPQLDLHERSLALSRRKPGNSASLRWPQAKR